MKKLLCLLMALLVSTSFVACVPVGDDGSDGNKSVLNVAVIDSGLGLAYAEEIEKDFEAYYANTSFEDGKMGVDVKLHPGLDEYSNSTLPSTIHNLETTVYILDRINYGNLVDQDLLVDITDTVREVVYDKDGNLAEESGEEAVYSIEDLMADGYSEFYTYKTNKYHGIPYRVSIGGLIYDADLFDERGLFFTANGALGAKYADIEETKRLVDEGKDGTVSKGPDGKWGTSDDGLADTMAMFSELLKYMRTTGVMPFSFSGSYGYTRTEAFEAFHANYEGYEDFKLNYTFSGTDSTLGAVREDVDKTHPDYYTKLLDQEGRKAALRFFQEIASNTGNYITSGNDGYNSMDQKQAQNEFIKSVDSNRPVAFLFEGGWWESEARETFDLMEYDDSDWGYGKRNLRLYAYPNMIGESAVADQTNTQRVLLGNCAGEGCPIFLSKVNAAENKELAERLGKKFIQFMNKRDQLVKFTKNTGGCLRSIVVPTDYTAEELSTLTKYGQSIYEYINEGARVFFKCSIADARISNPTGFGTGDGGWGFWAEPAGGQRTNCPIRAFRYTVSNNNGQVASVEELFANMKAKILADFAG